MINQLEHTTVIYPHGYLEPQKRVIGVSDVYRAVSTFSGIPDIGVKCQKAMFVYPRQIFCWVSRKYTSTGWKEIGMMIGGRDHTTAIHSVQKLQDLYDTEPQVRIDIASVLDIENR